MNFLPERDLKNCRLVSTQWYFPATKALQKSAKPITFGSLYKVNLIRLKPDLETIKLFMSTMEASPYIVPYVKFDLRPNVLAPNCLSLMDEFFTNFGPVITQLSISLAYESSDTFPKRCFPLLNLENLKTLEFCNSLCGELHPALTTELLTTRYNLLETILHAAPNLETLSLWADSENVAWPGEAIEVLRLAELPKLRNLKISFPMTNYQLVNLSRVNVQLTSFIFLIREPTFNTESLYKILASQANSLTNLKLVDLQCDQVKFLELPVMPKLKHFEVEGAFYGDHCRLSLLNFNFEKIPKIEKIILRNCHSRNLDLGSLLCGTGASRSLLEFHATAAHDFMNSKVIQEIPKIFPNLKNLHVMFSPEAKDSIF